MLQRTPVAIFVLVVGIAAWRLERTSRLRLAAALVISVGLVLIADDYFAGPIPGDWGLTGACGVVWGLRNLWDARRLASQQQS